MTENKKPAIQPATGKLGVMTVGMGAVATTLIAGVEAVRKGLAKPIGSVTQMGTIRLGKRTDNRTPSHQRIRSPRRPQRHRLHRLGHLPRGHVRGRRARRCPRQGSASAHQAFPPGHQAHARRLDQYYVKRLNGTHVKTGKSKCDLAQQLRSRHPEIQVAGRSRRRDLVRLDGNLPRAGRRVTSPSRRLKRAHRQRPRHRSVADLRLRRPQRRRALRQRRAEPHRRSALHDRALPSRPARPSAARTSKPARP